MVDYDGDLKWYTKDCDDCPYRHLDFCYWGKYIKQLVTQFSYGKDHKAKHCEFRNREPDIFSSYNIRFRRIPVKHQPKPVSPQGKLF